MESMKNRGIGFMHIRGWIFVLLLAVCLQGCKSNDTQKGADISALGTENDLSVGEQEPQPVAAMIEQYIPDKRFKDFFEGSKPAYYADGRSVFYQELPHDEMDWTCYRIGKALDIDNDGELEQRITGPYGGMFLDKKEDDFFFFACGEGTAHQLSYTYFDDAYWVVFSDTMHTGREYYWLYRYFGSDNCEQQIILHMNEEEEGNPKYYLNKEEITQDQYNELYDYYFH